MTDTFDAVLAEVRRLGLLGMPNAFDRLSAAHAAEVAERDALILELQADKAHLGRQASQIMTQALENGQAYHEQKSRAEAAEARVRELEADAGRYRWLREARCGSEDGEVEILLWRGEKGVIANHPDRDIDAAIDTAMQASREGR